MIDAAEGKCPMRSYNHCLMPVLRGRDHLDRRLTGLFPWHTTAILLNLFQPDLTEEENVIRLRDVASGAPKGVQRVMPVGPCHTVLLLAAVPTTARRAVEYATRLVGDYNFVVFAGGVALDRHGQAVAGSRLNADSLDQWAEHIGVRLRAIGLFDRTPAFLAYARAINLA